MNTNPALSADAQTPANDHEVDAAGAPPTPSEESPDCLAGALVCARRGFRVFPLHAVRDGVCTCQTWRDKQKLGPCKAEGKHPRLNDWQVIATSDPAEIQRLWRRFPNSNVGIATGQGSGVFVVDEDPRHGGDETLRALIHKYGPLPETLQAITGGGGSHRFFEHPGVPVPNDASGKLLGAGIDVRGDGGLVVAAPSVHKSGGIYDWDGLAGIDSPIAPAPAWLIQIVFAQDRAGEKPPFAVPEEIPKGRRNDMLYKFCCSLRGAAGGMDLAEILGAASAVNQSRCKPPVDEDEVRAIAESACKRPKGNTQRSVDVHRDDARGVVGAEFLLAQVRKTGAVRPVFDNIDSLAALSDAKLAVVYQDLKTVLGNKLNSNDFRRAIKEARTRQRKSEVPEEDTDRPRFQTNDRLLNEITADAIGALEAANDPPVVFRRGGKLVMIRPDEEGRPVIKCATEPMMRGRLARVARFFRAAKDGPIDVSPPEDLTLDVLTADEGNFPTLGVVTQLPILRRDGTVLLNCGYDPITRAYYHAAPGFRLGAVPGLPSSEDAAKAVQILREGISEFPFASEADEANCFALMLTPFLRVAYRMKAPLALIDAPKWGTGKTLLASLVYVLITGGEGTVCAAPKTANEEEWRKRITSILERGNAVVILDNVNETLRSPYLSAVLTTSNWEDRTLGKSEDTCLPNVSTWIATGNNLQLGAEMASLDFHA